MSGSTVDISWRVRNVGDDSTDASTWNDRVVLSADSVFDVSDTLLLDVMRDGALAPGEHYTVVQPVSLPVVRSHAGGAGKGEGQLVRQ